MCGDVCTQNVCVCVCVCVCNCDIPLPFSPSLRSSSPVSHRPFPLPFPLVLSYEKKIAKDNIAAKKGRVRSTLPQFMRSYFIHEYGLRKVALSKMDQFLRG